MLEDTTHEHKQGQEETKITKKQINEERCVRAYRLRPNVALSSVYVVKNKSVKR